MEGGAAIAMIKRARRIHTEKLLAPPPCPARPTPTTGPFSAAAPARGSPTISSELKGAGIEIGPGHLPFPLPSGLTVRYLYCWEPAENSALFPELGRRPGFPKPDIICDLDVDRLSFLPSSSQDFVIASPILEHLANPLAMLVDIYRVLKPQGLLGLDPARSPCHLRP